MAKQNADITSFDKLPAILQAKHLAEIMGLFIPLTYELMNSEGFPVIRIMGGKRLIVPKDNFILWLNSQSRQQ